MSWLSFLSCGLRTENPIVVIDSAKSKEKGKGEKEENLNDKFSLKDVD
jgi:hypothetical protein